jgi:DNA recombination protein RmuC
MVEPLTRVLDEVRAQVTAAEQARATGHAALGEQVRAMQQTSEQLRSETSRLVTALRASHVRGRWGELQLRRVVESAGMLEHVDFTEQAHHATDDGALRPDMLVHLPGDKQVIVDAKVAFSGYLEAMEARDDATRDKRLDAHARHMRDHIDQLGSKAYWEAVPGTPEFVVMFVPAEPFLNAALERDPTLFERAFARNVILATPATLVALLRTVGYTWRQEQLAGEAMQVLEVGRELHKRLGTMGTHLTTLGKRLNSTVEAYNAFNASLDRNVVTQARRFSALQGLEPSLDRTPPLEVLAVPAQKADLHAVPPQQIHEHPGMADADEGASAIA